MSLCPYYLHGTCLCFSSTLFKVTETEFNSDEFPMRRGRGRPRGSVYYIECMVTFEGVGSEKDIRRAENLISSRGCLLAHSLNLKRIFLIGFFCLHLLVLHVPFLLSGVALVARKSTRGMIAQTRITKRSPLAGVEAVPEGVFLDFPCLLACSSLRRHNFLKFKCNFFI